jgi:hypothetical protein
MEELTALAGHQPRLRELVQAAFAARLGPVPVTCDFYRGWNGGWRCRATAHGRPPLDFALLRTPQGALLAWPVPFPQGWRLRGVADALGYHWIAGDDGLPHPVVPTHES